MTSVYVMTKLFGLAAVLGSEGLGRLVVLALGLLALDDLLSYHFHT
jgi:hypothetical protein